MDSFTTKHLACILTAKNEIEIVSGNKSQLSSV